MELKRRDATDDMPLEKEKPEKQEEVNPKNIKKKEFSVILYTTILFFVALILILLSYFMQEHTNSKITNLSQQHGEITAQAMQNIEDLQLRNQELMRSLDQAEDKLDEAQTELETTNQKLEAMMAEQAGMEQANEASQQEIENLKAELQEQRGKTEAIGLLAALLSAPEGTDVSTIIEQLETKKVNLDAAYLNIYNSYIDNMNKEVESND